MRPARSILLITVALISVAAHADDSSVFESGKSRILQILDVFSNKWIDNGGRGVDEEKPTVDSSQIEQNGESVQPDKQGEGEKKPPQGAPAAGPPPRSGRARTTALWMPMCFLVDPSHDPTTINQNIKRLVDEYGQCGIAVEPFAFTIAPGYPQDVQQMNNLARQACDFDRAFTVRGAIQVAVNSPQIPQAMCRDTTVTGCSTLCERLSVSYIAPGSGPDIAVHESLHSNCCGRLCVNNGEGTQNIGYGIDLVFNQTPAKIFHGEPANTPKLSDAKPENGGLNPEACASLQQGASPNDGTHRWDPNKLNFYARATDAGAYKPLDGRSFFTAKSGRTSDPKHMGDSGGGGDSKRVGSVTFDDNAKKGESKPTKEAIAADETKHRNQAGTDPLVQSLLGNLKDIESQAGDPDKLQFTRTPAAAAAVTGASRTRRVTFDDSAPKVRSTGGGTSYGTAGPSAKPVSGAGGGSTAFDDPSGGSTLGTSASFDGNFFDSMKEKPAEPVGEPARGSTLRSRDLSSLKRESSTGLSQRTDVLISTRPDPGRISGEQAPTPGTY
jgi:hypothetical protein